MFGPVRGSVIRVARGPSNLKVEDAAEAPALVGITEGIEDALTMAIAGPEARVWAATSLSNLANVPVSLPASPASWSRKTTIGTSRRRKPPSTRRSPSSRDPASPSS
jgi:hypothetical protein